MEAYIIKMQLLHSEAPIWRTLAIASTATFGDLAKVCQVAAGYYSGHSWEFIIPELKARLTNDTALLSQAQFLKSDRGKAYLTAVDRKKHDIDCSVLVADADDIPLMPMVENYPHFRFLYDFTDEWIWEMAFQELEEVVVDLPFLIDGMGTAPFENVGGLSGYYEIVEALTNNTDEAGALREWLNKEGLCFFDKEQVNWNLQNKIRKKS